MSSRRAEGLSARRAALPTKLDDVVAGDEEREEEEPETVQVRAAPPPYGAPAVDPVDASPCVEASLGLDVTRERSSSEALERLTGVEEVRPRPWLIWLDAEGVD